MLRRRSPNRGSPRGFFSAQGLAELIHEGLVSSQVAFAPWTVAFGAFLPEEYLAELGASTMRFC